MISKNSVSCDPEKVSALLNAPSPSNKSELKSFLGLVQYYAKFCKNLATVSTSMRELLKKDVEFVWSNEC